MLPWNTLQLQLQEKLRVAPARDRESLQAELDQVEQKTVEVSQVECVQMDEQTPMDQVAQKTVVVH